jgi:iron complex outermembrane receptor protein
MCTNRRRASPLVSRRIRPVNLNLSWESIFDSPVDASFFVTNLLDDTYYTYSTGGYNSPGFGFDAMTIGSQPRFFGGRVKLRFGADAH